MGSLRADSKRCSPNTVRLTVVIRYPFHPLCGVELAVVPAHGPNKQLQVRGPDGHFLLVPPWMVEPSAGQISVQNQPEIHGKACMDAAELLRLARSVCEAIQVGDSEIAGRYRGGKPRRPPCDSETSTSSARTAQPAKKTSRGKSV